MPFRGLTSNLSFSDHVTFIGLHVFALSFIEKFTGSAETLIKTFNAPSSNMRPTSVDFVSTEPQQLLAAYTASYASIIDLETGHTVLTFDFGG